MGDIQNNNTASKRIVLVACPECHGSFYVGEDDVQRKQLCPICNKEVLLLVVNQNGKSESSEAGNETLA